ncbi:DUF378 domain-containing protein [Lentibacillus saliphilus]|uniref:DUF378 domain-containing protein n=1 Tax=Lentibacillus saliphilus TaxID=2737028 RepID=UPI001C304603|nr:DUF378 domain-containing protein [Lentibacillus saliphilus]
MKRRGISILIYGIIGLAAIGLVSQLFGNTAAFLSQIVFMVGMAALFLLVFYFIFVRKRPPSDEAKKYKQAVKQSKIKYRQGQQMTDDTSGRRNASGAKQKKPTKRRASHLRVIDGNKSKRKKRVSN